MYCTYSTTVHTLYEVMMIEYHEYVQNYESVVVFDRMELSTRHV